MDCIGDGKSRATSVILTHCDAFLRMEGAKVGLRDDSGLLDLGGKVAREIVMFRLAGG
jgi:hypothetical protein